MTPQRSPEGVFVISGAVNDEALEQLREDFKRLYPRTIVLVLRDPMARGEWIPLPSAEVLE